MTNRPKQMMDMENAWKALQKLVDKYNLYKDDKSFIGNEKQACRSLIEPLVKDVLHWDVDDPAEFKTEVQQTGKRIDYVVSNQGISQFIIEAKAPSKDIFDNEEYYKQTLAYGYGKQKDFAILTNFKQVVILACQVQWRNPREAELARFNLLTANDEELKLLLTFEKEYWNSTGKDNSLYLRLLKHKRTVAVDERLLDDLRHWRELLLRNIKLNSRFNHFDFEDEKEFMHVEEEVQNFINRLIFISFCEDKELHEPYLKQYLHDGRELKSGWLLGKIRELFAEYRRIYDSDLFDKSDCDEFKIDDDKILEIIEQLREPKEKAAYDFKSIEADILGKTYENFIGHVQAGKKRFTEKEDIGKRKKGGIYYTPKYIVDYIVNNTVREEIKGKSFEEIKKVRILDPACGSGSFLLRVFEVLVEESESREKRKLDYQEKKDLMLNCIHGVDLDSRAVSIAKLNLSLKMAERGEKLPMLHDNLRQGNSLIDDKEVAGWNAFVWEEEFKEIMSEGGFDVVVGNPPYVFTRDVEFQDSFKKYVQEHYFNGLESISKSHAKQSGKVNLYALFLIKSIHLLSNQSLFGFIIPNNILRTTTYDIIRKFILNNCKILKIVDLGAGVFEGVTASTIILILQKEKDQNKRNKNKVIIYPDINNLSDKKEIEQKGFLENTSYAFNITLNKNEKGFFEKIEDKTIFLGEIASVYCGIATGANKKEMITNYKKSEKYKPLLEGKDVKSFYPVFDNKYIQYDRKLLHRPRKESIFLSPEKIVTQRIGGGNRVLIACYDNRQFYTFNSTNNILSKNKSYSLKYLVAVLNSKLINWYYVNKFTNKSVLTVNISKTFLDQLPIKIVSEPQQQPLIKLVDHMLSLNKQLQEEKNEEHKKKIQKEIERTDKEIDELVYKLYGITEEEKKIIEESLK